MPPSFEEAVHLVSSPSAAGWVLHAGARRKRICWMGDDLTSGPCDVDPDRHVELRRAWDANGWRRRLSLDDLRAALDGDLPVVLWGTRAFDELVWIWWVLDGLGRIPAERQRRFLARPRPADPLEATGGCTPDEVRAALAVAQPILEAELREGAELWTQYASPSPLAFDEARRRGSRVFPELTRSAEPHGRWFPRLRGDRLHLSDLDEILLGCLDDSWRTIHDLLPSGARDRWTWMQPFGALSLAERLRAWAEHGAVAHEKRAEDHPFDDVFRATQRTRHLLDHGLEQVGDAPPLHVGGCRVNDPASPWVRIDDDAGWRLALHGRP